MKTAAQHLNVIYGYFKVFVYDTYRFIRYSGTYRIRSFAPSRGARMTKYYHMVEKGLALPQPRPGFGAQATADLSDQISTALRDGVCIDEVALAADALDSYVAFNSERGHQSPKHVTDVLQDVRRSGIAPSGAALREVSKSPSSNQSNIDFLVSRVSVREYSDAAVPKQVLLEATRAAQSAPCVCNRQAARVYFLTSEQRKAEALRFQKGNRGFGDSAPVIAIITVDIAELLEPIERYQHWIDGGLFAQNFLLGIHAQGYGACPLNWSAPISCDIGIRKLGYIPDSESIIMMIAIGALKPTYKVARSQRRRISDVAHFLDPDITE